MSSEVQPDDLEQIARGIWPDRQDARWISVGVEIDDDERVVDRVQNRRVPDAVLARRTVDLHTVVS